MVAGIPGVCHYVLQDKQLIFQNLNLYKRKAKLDSTNFRIIHIGNNYLENIFWHHTRKS